MEDKINPRAIQEYSAAYATSITQSFFSNHTRISGRQIISLCDLSQINYFIIWELLKAWRQETRKYRSPYFDYTANEVKTALIRFQNILSNNISVGRDHFLPLLQKSVSLTIYLIMSPYNFYSYILNKNGKIGALNVQELKSEVKYIKINHAPLDRLVEQLEAQRIEKIPGKQAFTLFNQILEDVNFTPEDVDSYAKQLNKVATLDIPKLYDSQSKTAEENPNLEQDMASSLHPLTSSHPSTVAENYERISYLKDRLTVNQKFMFTKILFNGDLRSFNDVINHIDSATSLEEVINYLDSTHYGWNNGSEEYKEFMKLLTSRFS